MICILQILEYNRKKQQREAEYEKEMLEKKKLRERKINKVQSNQKASQDTQALKDELMAIRTQDKVIIFIFLCDTCRVYL